MSNKQQDNGEPPFPSWEDLNAYVDGELTKAQRARVAAAIATDSTLADKIAVLSQLKAELAVSDAADQGIEGPKLEDLVKKARQKKDPRVRIPLWKQAIGWVAGITLIGMTAYNLGSNQMDTPAWVTSYGQQHQQASQMDTAHPRHAMVLAANHLKREIHIPDLSDAGLTLVRTGLRHRSTGNADTVQLLYRGPNGCRVSLWITRALPNEKTNAAYRLDQDKVIAWTVGDLRYALLSSMDERRFDLIAHMAKDQVEEHYERQQALTIALNKVKETALPCA